jgi:electron transfer flavoprotein alpha subunit
VILVIVEHEQDGPAGASLEALTLGRQLAEPAGQPLHVVQIGGAAESAVPGLSAFGVAAIHLAVHEAVDPYAPAAWARCVEDLIDALEPAAVLAAGTDRGNEVLAHVAARTDLPMAANCIDVRRGEPGQPFVVTRLRWGGSLVEEAQLDGRVKLLTVAPHAVAVEPTAERHEPSVRPFTPTMTDRDLAVRVTGRVPAASGSVSLAEARVVVGGGRGAGSADGFGPLEELARLLGGAVGCSRVVTSLGWRPHSDQIGQTGTRIAPDLYIACGISGAIQHIVGCKGAKRILAINTDPEAPIMARADFAVIGDLQQVVEAVNAEIRRSAGSGG